jgi:DNA-binding transcriptional ArsR family regulator
MGDQQPPETDEQEDGERDPHDALAPILNSTHRHAVLHAMVEDGPLTPTDAADHTSIDSTHVSRAISSLRDYGLVELLVPEDVKKGRLYGATDYGEDVHALSEQVADPPEKYTGGEE